VFLIEAHHAVESTLSDTSQADKQLPLYRFEAVGRLTLPERCVVIGVELLEGATLLPSFRHR
jgi:hypothetical protein